MDESVRVVIRITKPCFEPETEEIRITTTISESTDRNWRLEETHITNYIGFNEFFLETRFPRNCLMRYKLMVLKVKDQLIQHVEEFERVTRLGHVPVMIQMIYNDPKVNISELRAYLTKSGSPLNVFVSTPGFRMYKPMPGGWDVEEEDRPDEECDIADYFASESKVVGTIRSAPNTIKPDLTEGCNCKCRVKIPEGH